MLLKIGFAGPDFMKHSRSRRDDRKTLAGQNIAALMQHGYNSIADLRYMASPFTYQPRGDVFWLSGLTWVTFYKESFAMRNLMLCTLAGLLSPALVWAQSTKEEIHKLKDEIAALQKENARLKNELARIRPLEQLQGQWKPVSAEVGGAAVRFAPGQRFHVKGNIQTTLLDGKPFGDATRLDIDATADPKIIDWIRPNGEVMEGIYKLEGRRLILCFQREDGVKNRPLTFETKRGDNRLLLVYEKED